MPKALCRYGMTVLGKVYAMCALPQGHQEEVRSLPPLEMFRWGGHRLMLTDGRYLNAPFTCGHCGRPCGDMAGGFAIVPRNPATVRLSSDPRSVRVCHPNAKDRPDCYRLITVYHEVVGVRLHETVLGWV